MPRLLVETAKSREPSGLSTAETNVSGTTASGAPTGSWVSTSQRSTVPSALDVASERAPRPRLWPMV
jgi:hypothetical protein